MERKNPDPKAANISVDPFYFFLGGVYSVFIAHIDHYLKFIIQIMAVIASRFLNCSGATTGLITL
jgi:hypothetical protein